MMMGTGSSSSSTSSGSSPVTIPSGTREPCGKLKFDSKEKARREMFPKFGRNNSGYYRFVSEMMIMTTDDNDDFNPNCSLDEEDIGLSLTMYPFVAARYDGPSLVVLDMEAGDTNNDTAKEDDSALLQKNDPLCHVKDAGRIFPTVQEVLSSQSSVVGFELRRRALDSTRMTLMDTNDRNDTRRGRSHRNEKQIDRSVPSITHAFYKQFIPKLGNVVFVLHFPLDTVYCIHQSPISIGSFFHCDEGESARQSGDTKETMDSHCVRSRHRQRNNDTSNEMPTLLGVTGVIFTQQIQDKCPMMVQKLLRGLPVPRQHSFSNSTNTDFILTQSFQNVLATVASRLGKDLSIAYYHTHSRDDIICQQITGVSKTSSHQQHNHNHSPNNLWEYHREVSSMHIGLDTQYATCVAELPRNWTYDEVAWNASIHNPLQETSIYHPFETTPQSIDVTTLHRYNRGGDIARTCFGYRDSLCVVQLTSRVHLEKLRISCHFECTYTTYWMASPKDSHICHSLARDMLTMIVSDSSHVPVWQPKVVHPGTTYRKRLTQSELDPLQWTPTHPGSIHIVTTSDVHGYIHGKCNDLLCSAGGASYLASVLETIRQSSMITRDPVLVLDGGDAFFGSGVEPREVAEVMNRLGYDAMALGNHDLDIGLEKFSDLVGYADFEVLAANAVVKGVDLPRHVVKELVVGDEVVRVCLIGFTTPEQNPLAGPDGLRFTRNRMESIVSDIIDNKRRLQCDIQIVMSHLGLKQDEILADLISSNDSGDKSLDLIIGGHSHIILASDLGRSQILRDVDNEVRMESFPALRGRGVPVAHAGSNGLYTGILRVQKDSPSQQTKVQGDLRALNTNEGVFRKQGFLIPPSDLGNNASYIHVNSPSSVCSISCRKEECILGNFVANAMRECITSSSCKGGSRARISHPAIALLESGTVRGCLKNGHNSLKELLPWPNELVILTLNSSAIRAMLHHGLETKSKQQGGGFLQTAGLSYSYRGSRVLGMWQQDYVPTQLQHQTLILSSEKSVTFELTPPSAAPQSRNAVRDNQQQYSVIVTDWLASGGDGYGPVLEGLAEEVQYTNVTLEDAILFYSSKGPTVSREMRSVDVDQTTSSSMLRSLVALLGSLIASICSYPLYTMSVLKATSHQSHKRGLRLQDGVFIAAFAGAFSNAIFFFFFHLTADNLGSSFAQSIVAAVINVLLTNPIWVVVTRVQTSDVTTSFRMAAGMIYAKEGIRGFFDGISMNMMMIIYPTIRHLGLEAMQFFGKHFVTSHLFQGSCAAVASVFATIVTYPIQRWRLQLQAGGDCRFSGLFDGICFKLGHSGFTNFILFATMSSSEGIIDYILTE